MRHILDLLKIIGLLMLAAVAVLVIIGFVFIMGGLR